MTVAEIEKMSAREVAEWFAFYRIENDEADARELGRRAETSLANLRRR